MPQTGFPGAGTCREGSGRNIASQLTAARISSAPYRAGARLKRSTDFDLKAVRPYWFSRISPENLSVNPLPVKIAAKFPL